MNKKTILSMVYNELNQTKTKEEERSELLHAAQNFNDADGRGVHSIIVKTTYEAYAKYTPGKRGYCGLKAPKLEAVTYKTIHFSNQQGTSWTKRTKSHGTDISEATRDSWHRPVSIDELKSLGIKNPKYGRFHCHKNIKTVTSLDQLYVQYYPVVKGQVGHTTHIDKKNLKSKFQIFFQGGKQVHIDYKEVCVTHEDISYDPYIGNTRVYDFYKKPGSAQPGLDICLVLSLNNFVKVVSAKD